MLYSILGYVPNDISLYRMAMTHSSAGSRKLGCNERLEFLGDAVLSSIVSDYLYSNFVKEREGFLSKSRSNLVCRLHAGCRGGNIEPQYRRRRP